jgi:deoxyhypusine synthase
MKPSLIKKTKFMGCTTSYGTYSGAVPNEKITWDQFDADTPKFMIESEATIVAPLIFARV